MTHADKAAQLVLGNRNADYGNPRPDFAGIALMWSGLLNTKLKEHLTAEEVALMMVALKLRRESHKHKDDNIIDAHGYLLCLQWVIENKRPTPQAEENWETVEDVATGGRLTCPTCKKTMPCLCTHADADPVTEIGYSARIEALIQEWKRRDEEQRARQQRAVENNETINQAWREHLDSVDTPLQCPETTPTQSATQTDTPKQPE